MAVESYDQIMARLNNPYGYAPVQPKTPASDFTQYVQTLMANTNPQGGMFGMQDIIDERMRKSKEAAAAKTAQAAGGMFVPASGGGGESGGDVQLTKEQLEFLGRELPEERYARITGDWFGLKPIAGMLLDPLGTFLTYPKQEPAPVSVATGQTPTQIAQQQREIEQRVIAEFARKMEAEKQAEALAAARAAQEAMNASANYQDSNYQPYSDSGGGYTGMSYSNSNAGTSGSPSYGAGGFL